MPRIAGYVADELWEGVRRTRPDQGTSALLQEGLKCLLASEEPFAAIRRGVTDDRMARIVSRLRVEADADYKEGYERGVSLLDREDEGVPVIGWEMLDMLAEDWDVFAWRARLNDRWQVDLEDLDAALSYEGWDGRPAAGPRSSAFLAGFVAAMKDARSAVTRGSSG